MRPLPEEEDVDEKKYYGILMKNIKLWKYSQESVSSSCGSDSSWYYLEGRMGNWMLLVKGLFEILCRKDLLHNANVYNEVINMILF